MAKKAKKIKTGKGLKLEIVNPHAAGIDVSSTEMQVCVPEDRDSDNNRRFGTFTEDLHYISSWLKACGITTVAMESTGVYWVQLYMILEADGFDVLLVNKKIITYNVYVHENINKNLTYCVKTCFLGVNKEILRIFAVMFKICLIKEWIHFSIKKEYELRILPS